LKIDDSSQPESGFPAGLSSPARRALAEAGYQNLEQLAGVRSADLLKLHGFGPKSIGQLREALAAKNLAFADDDSE
jgi:DNA-directed RNA polymerase alpha subunit